MKTMMRHVCTALIALGFATTHAHAAAAGLEPHGTSAARAGYGADALPSWSGSIAGAAGDEVAAVMRHDMAVAEARTGAPLLTSWGGSIPGAAPIEVAPTSRRGGASALSAAQVLASWSAF